jgi:hypothetical protein
MVLNTSPFSQEAAFCAPVRNARRGADLRAKLMALVRKSLFFAQPLKNRA